MRTAFVPVLMLTAHEGEDEIARGFGVGADDYMVKPFRREGLVARVRRILERTYGSKTAGAPPLPPLPATEALPASNAATADPDAMAFAALAAVRDALRLAIEGFESRLGEIAARPAGTAPIPAAVDVDAVRELRTVVSELRAHQEQMLAEVRDETRRTRSLAEEALRTANGAAAALSPTQFTSMETTVEQLQGEQSPAPLRARGRRRDRR